MKKPKKRAVALVSAPALPNLVDRISALERKIGSLVADQDGEIARLRAALAEMTKDRDIWRMKCEHLQGQFSQRLLHPQLRY